VGRGRCLETRLSRLGGVPQPVAESYILLDRLTGGD